MKSNTCPEGEAFTNKSPDRSDSIDYAMEYKQRDGKVVYNFMRKVKVGGYGVVCRYDRGLKAWRFV